MSGNRLTSGVFLDPDSVDRGDLDMDVLRAVLPHWEFLAADDRRPVAERIADAEVVVTNKVVLDRPVLAALPAVKLVCVAATGYNNVDVAAAGELGIPVCNARSYATPSVVEHVFMLILALRRRLAEHRDAVRDGQWRDSSFFCVLDYPFTELAGCTLGIIGYGELGRAVGAVAEAFGMRVMIGARPGSGVPEGRVAIPELLRRADIISLHCPLTPETRALIGTAQLASMKPGALLINTARGGIVDEAALLAALQDGQLGGAGFDVLAEEPPAQGSVLVGADLPNLIVTPHVAWASREARQRLLGEISANIAAFQAGKSRNLVVPV